MGAVLAIAGLLLGIGVILELSSWADRWLTSTTAQALDGVRDVRPSAADPTSERQSTDDHLPVA